jgi:hypothetical protein
MCVTETFDAGLFGEGVVSSILNAWKNVLNPPDPAMRIRDEREIPSFVYGEYF